MVGGHRGRSQLRRRTNRASWRGAGWQRTSRRCPSRRARKERKSSVLRPRRMLTRMEISTTSPTPQIAFCIGFLHRRPGAPQSVTVYRGVRRLAPRTKGTKSGPVHRLTARQSRLTCVRRATGRSALSYTHQQQQCNRRHSRVEVQWDTRTRPSSASTIVRDCEPWHTASHSSRAHPPNTHRSRRGSSSTPSGTHLHTHLYIPYGRSRMAESTTPYRAALQIVSIARRETNLARHAPLPLSLPRHRQGCARPDQ